MPLTDPRQVAGLEDAFDLSNPSIVLWELELIWAAVGGRLIRFDEHGMRAATDESIPLDDVLRIILTSSQRSKDTTRDGGRQIGINFEGKDRRGRSVRAKVSWFGGYVVVTVHTL